MVAIGYNHIGKIFGHIGNVFARCITPKLGYQKLILEDLEKTKCELDTAYRGFDYVTDPDLIDCYIYDINAILKRYKYLLELVAETKEEAIPLPYPSDAETTVTACIS